MNRQAPPQRRAPGLPHAPSCRQRSGGEQLTPILKRLAAAALDFNGDLPRIMAALELTPATLRRQVRQLRCRGFANTLSLIDLDYYRREIEFVVLVRIDHAQADAMALFEDWCIGDAAVSRAALVTGAFDYQLSVFHRDLRAANAWRRALESRPEVARIDHRQVAMICGHRLAGIPLVKRQAPCGD